MFTGIIQEIAIVCAVLRESKLLKFAVEMPKKLTKGLKKGASLSIDGVCQTVVSIEGNYVWMEAIEETLRLTTLAFLEKGCRVNVERSLKVGEEMGGHFLTGHIFGKATLSQIKENRYTFTSPIEWTKYLFSKGSIAINGVSLTVAEVDPQKGAFTTHLIPYTLRHTTLSEKKVGDLVNVELDPLVYAATHYLDKIADRFFCIR